MANQYTEAREKGLEPGDEGYPQGSNQFTTGKRTEHPEEVRSLMRASAAARYLNSVIEDPSKEDTVRLAATKIVLDKTVSSLSSVDQTVRNETDQMDEESLMAMLKAIVAANPALLSRLQAEIARSQAGANVGNPSLQVVDKVA